MSLFVLDEFKMALSQSEKFVRKTKAEAKPYRCIIEDPKLHDASNEKSSKQYAATKRKKKGKEPLKKVIEAQRIKWKTQNRNSNLLPTVAVSWSFWFHSEFSMSHWDSITFFNGSLSFFFCLDAAYCFELFSLRASWRSSSSGLASVFLFLTNFSDWEKAISNSSNTNNDVRTQNM